MCGRFELHTSPAAIALAFGLPHPPAIGPRFNIAPMQDVPVIRTTRSGERELAQVRWGLVPRWAKDPSIGARMINARAETLDREARVPKRAQVASLPPAGRRLLRVEERAGAAASSRYHIGMKDGTPFALAGLTERWLSPEGEVLDTCTIVTTPANALIAPLHDRMPLIIAPEDYARWLDRAVDDVVDLLSPYSADAMNFYPVSTRVNAVQQRRPVDHRADRDAPRERGRAPRHRARAGAGEAVLATSRARPAAIHAPSVTRSASVIPVRLPIGIALVEHRLLVDLLRIGDDQRRRVEQHALRRLVEARLRRLRGVTCRAAFRDDRLHLRRT